MSRRKQARPSRLVDDEEAEQSGALDLQVPAGSNESKASLDNDKDVQDTVGPAASGNDEPGCDGNKREEAVRRQEQDAANNNSVGREEEDPALFSGVPGHVTLEALQNTKVAVAQIPIATRDEDNLAGFQELAELQSTLFTLQHQQMIQLTLIQKIQSHLTVGPKEDETDVTTPSTSAGVPMPAALPIQQPCKQLRVPTPNKTDLQLPAASPPPSQTIPPSHKQTLTIPKPPIPIPVPMSIPHPPQHPSMCSISSSLASSIITNNDPPPSLNEPNTLEMLQKRAQEVLDNASQGLLANNLADELAFRKNGKNSLSPLSGGRNEPFFKHRCRYCGKVFGSDSALQIHIRSHTGERPFKCNVCGSRFTTKGNLKVHFQRHSAKFPHVKMNPNPVPEHLDKFHPPLLAQMSNQSMPPGMPPHHPGPPHHQYPGSPPFPPPGLPLFRPPLPHDLMHRPPQLIPPLRPHEANLLKPLLPLAMFAPRDEQDMPENLSKPQQRSSPSPRSSSRSRSISPVSFKQEACSEIKKETIDDQQHDSDLMTENNIRSPSRENIGDNVKMEEEPFSTDIRRTEQTENGSFDDRSMEDEEDQRMSRIHEPDSDEARQEVDFSSHYDDCSADSKYSDDDEMHGRCSVSNDQPENLSSKSPGARSASDLTSQRLPPTLSFLSGTSPHSSSSSHDVDPAKDPAIYNSLLPRPGSNDNSWESLIEVTKTSETSKLQQLVDNIENKLTDPNQCVICHRVLSCKSALQMHYRTHTGERPFRCKICGRAFTTKGNLKTHMGVHRLKPPMRVQHQCPVCHKKFTNGLVLQQHIRLHTGEQPEMTLEQIHACEIKDYPPHSGGFPPYHGSFPLPGYGLSRLDGTDKDDDMFDDYDDDFSNSSGSPQSQYPSNLDVQSRTAPGGLASNLSAEDLTISKSPPPAIEMNGCKSPLSPRSQCESPLPSPRPPSPPRLASPNDSDSHGALDLTPRTPSIPPGPLPPPTLFPGLGLLATSGPSPLMSSALSSLTTSVLTSTAFSPLGLALGPAARGNTTCNICFKTFACNSALEIHYRSHTKERPFKCGICDRGFSTKRFGRLGWCPHQWRTPRGGEKDTAATGGAGLPPWLRDRGCAPGWHLPGNMKQHMLTHKIRDMPPHLFENTRSPTYPAPPSNHSEDNGDASNGPVSIGEGPVGPVGPPESPVKLETRTSPPIKRSPPEGDLPLPKRPPTGPKHLCQVCTKNFSSSSALQIHMRTHTGDKPFRCTVCQKAFTTKGNLKVHMGTHMWNNSTSRRGRRMSLDLPPIPMTPKDSEFLQRRPDLFYPYLPTPFLNGVQQKINEMSAIQSGLPGNGLHHHSKYGGLFHGFGGYGATDKLSQQSPSPDKPSSPPLALSLNSRRGSPPSRGSVVGDELPRGVWDMHFDRKSEHSDDHVEVAPPGRMPPRGESLAA